MMHPGMPVGSDSNVTRFKGSRVSHGVAQAAIHSQVAPQGTGVVDVHNADIIVKTNTIFGCCV